MLIGEDAPRTIVTIDASTIREIVMWCLAAFASIGALFSLVVKWLMSRVDASQKDLTLAVGQFQAAIDLWKQEHAATIKLVDDAEEARRINTAEHERILSAVNGCVGASRQRGGP